MTFNTSTRRTHRASDPPKRPRESRSVSSRTSVLRLPSSTHRALLCFENIFRSSCPLGTFFFAVFVAGFVARRSDDLLRHHRMGPLHQLTSPCSSRLSTAARLSAGTTLAPSRSPCSHSLIGRAFSGWSWTPAACSLDRARPSAAVPMMAVGAPAGFSRQRALLFSDGWRPISLLGCAILSSAPSRQRRGFVAAPRLASPMTTALLPRTRAPPSPPCISALLAREMWCLCFRALALPLCHVGRVPCRARCFPSIDHRVSRHKIVALPGAGASSPPASSPIGWDAPEPWHSSRP